MKRILLLLALLLAPSAFADDAVTSFGWNSVTGTFQAMTRALGWKQIPDQVIYSNNPTITVTSGAGTCTNFTNSNGTLVYTKTGRLLTIDGQLGCGSESGTVAAISVPIPNGWTCASSAGTFSDYWTTNVMCRGYITTGAPTTVQMSFFSPATGTSTSVTGTGGCFVHLSCQTTN